MTNHAPHAPHAPHTHNKMKQETKPTWSRSRVRIWALGYSALCDAVAARDATATERAISEMIFAGASTTEPRGISDARLTLRDMNMALEVMFEGAAVARAAGKRPGEIERMIDWLVSYLSDA